MKINLFFSETELFLRKNGFEIWDIRRVYQKDKSSLFHGYKRGAGIGRCIIFKNPSKLHADLKNLKEADWKKIILDSAEIAKVYGYSDYVVDLINSVPSYRNKNFVSQKLEFKKKDRLTTDSMFSKLRYKFSKFLSKTFFISAKIDPYDSGFKTGDSSLGNKKIK